MIVSVIAFAEHGDAAIASMNKPPAATLMPLAH